MSNDDESELTRFRHGERVSCEMCGVSGGGHRHGCPEDDMEPTDAEKVVILTVERDAATAAERRRIRSMLAGKIVETRREMRDGWSVPPEYMFDRIAILREIGKAVSK
jgi:hypothetical protein